MLVNRLGFDESVVHGESSRASPVGAERRQVTPRPRSPSTRHGPAIFRAGPRRFDTTPTRWLRDDSTRHRPDGFETIRHDAHAAPPRRFDTTTPDASETIRHDPQKDRHRGLRAGIRCPDGGSGDGPSGETAYHGRIAIYLCHTEPDLYVHEAEILDVRPGAVALSRSAFHPGGGGQVSDVGRIEWSNGSATVTHIEIEGDTWWHVLDDATVTPTGTVRVSIDADHRLGVASLHTMSHVLNALVFDEFAGALVTGAQINGDGTGRMDFDLPEVDNDRLRALEGAVNDVIGRSVEVTSVYVPVADATPESGLMRSMSVAPPPTPEGTFRVIDIAGVDRQACGGTHLTNTGQSRPIRISKVENKGRHNRRVRFRFAD